MGLDISPVALLHEPHWRWAYSSFNRLRTAIAERVGMPLQEMAGFVDGPNPGKPWIEATYPNAAPLFPLLNHSDCDGELSSFECETIAPIVAAMRFDDENIEQMRADLAEVLRAGAEHHGVHFH